MKRNPLSIPRIKKILAAARKTRVLVVGDVMLDQFIWGSVARISPEAPVPVVDFQRESFMPGGAANVARNLTAMGVSVELFGAVGPDTPADILRTLLRTQKIGCRGLVTSTTRRMRLMLGDVMSAMSAAPKLPPPAVTCQSRPELMVGLASGSSTASTRPVGGSGRVRLRSGTGPAAAR